MRPERSTKRGRVGFSLIELLCVMAIIMILVSMLLGPVFKALKRARGLESELQASSFPTQIAGQLRDFYDGQTVFPALRPDELGALGALDGNCLAYLRKPGVIYFPFSSRDPATKVILQVSQGRKIRAMIYKRDIVK